MIIAERNKIAGTYKGVPQGTGVTVKDENRYRLHSKSTITKQTDAILMTAAEVWFLRAEAALRGFTSENVKDCYEKGITVSCQQWGVNVGDYLTSDATPSDYADAFEAKYDVEALIKVTRSGMEVLLRKSNWKESLHRSGLLVILKAMRLGQNNAVRGIRSYSKSL